MKNDNINSITLLYLHMITIKLVFAYRLGTESVVSDTKLVHTTL